LGVFLEHVDEQLADDLALGFRVRDAVKLAKKKLLLFPRGSAGNL